jgi:hypothetical protein
MNINRLFLLICVLNLFSCAILHHVQVGEIDNRSQFLSIPFDFKVSEVGVDVKQSGKIIDALSRNKNKEGEKLADLVSLFQMGPRTGLPVYSTKWTEQVFYKLYEICPTGQITGLTSVRENRNYGPVSGEILKFTGFCLKNKI